MAVGGARFALSIWGFQPGTLLSLLLRFVLNAVMQPPKEQEQPKGTAMEGPEPR